MVDIQDFCAALYCAQVRGTSFTVTQGSRIDVVAWTVTDGSAEYYRVEFDGVSQFSWLDNNGQPVVVDLNTASNSR